MKDYSKQFLIENIYILVDKDYLNYKEKVLNKYLIIDFDEHNVTLLSNHGLLNKYENYKHIEWIPNNLEIGKQFQKIEMTFYNENYIQLMYAYETVNLPIHTYLKPMRKYHTSIQDRRTIDICSILISDDDLSHLSDIKNLTNRGDAITSFLTEH
jgi:hypothetical protein